MKFYDTCALLDLGEAAFDEKFLLSNITLLELEDIKTSGKKSEDVRYKARQVGHLLADPAHNSSYEVVSISADEYENIVADLSVPIANINDCYILAAAFKYYYGLLAELESAGTVVTAESVEIGAEADSFKFVTSDLSCANIAANVFKLPVELTRESSAPTLDYKGWTEIQLGDGGEDALATFYQNPEAAGANVANTPLNGYLVIKDGAGATIDMMRWDGERYVPLKYKKISNRFSGDVKPLNDQQRLAFDMLQNDSITVKLLTGSFGSGKTMLMVSTAIDMIEKQKFEKLIWIRNNVEVKNTKPLGYLPGTLNDKIGAESFAGPLADHLGGRSGLEYWMNSGKVELAHLGFIRGRDFSNAILLVSEAENLTKEHVQLLLGRVGRGSALWLDGDLKQTDEAIFEQNNGLRKLITSLTGDSHFGHVYMPITERSETARLADKLD